MIGFSARKREMSSFRVSTGLAVENGGVRENLWEEDTVEMRSDRG